MATLRRPRMDYAREKSQRSNLAQRSHPPTRGWRLLAPMRPVAGSPPLWTTVARAMTTPTVVQSGSAPPREAPSPKWRTRLTSRMAGEQHCLEVDVAGAGKAPLIVQDSGMVVYTGRPISSKVAHARHAESDVQARKVEHECCSTVASLYLETNIRDEESIQLPLPRSNAAAVDQLLDKTRLSNEAYHVASGSTLIFQDSDAWVPGRQRRVHQALNNVTPRTANSSLSAELTTLLAELFLQVR